MADWDERDVAGAETVRAAEATTLRDAAAAETVRVSPDVASAETARSMPDVASAETALPGATQSGPAPVRVARAAAPFAPGTLLDEYIVGDVIGEGGMGVVVSARDPDLDRAVAIKVLRRGAFGVDGAAEARTRLLREAQAMAKLSHPNVITVFRVGEVDGQVFVAMELVDGGTLRSWIKRKSRREILDAYIAAGSGLAAAHAAGLVHRDFKPDNVLVGKDGRVRVTDFGLVAESPIRPEALAPVRSSLGLTQSGVVIGTPVYMAPEQHRGEPTDARADQFAFCVALYEALDGERPFAGDTYDELVDNVVANRVREPARDAIPRRLRQTLLRGMSADPAQRFASMDELLARLRPRSRTPLWIAAVALVAIGAGGATWLVTRGDAPACDTGRERLAKIWDAPRKAQLRAAFEATHRATAGATYDRAAALLDAWTERWVEMTDATCRARREQPEAMIERRTVCLERRLDEANRLVGAMIDGTDASALDVSVKAVSALSRVEDCANASRLQVIAPLPADPVARDKIAALSRELDDARAADRLGKQDRALALADKIAGDIAATGYAPLVAAHLVALGKLQERATKLDDSVKTLRKAIEEAARAGDPAIEAEALSSLLFTVGVRQGDAKRAEDLAIAGRSAVARAESDEQYVRFENVLAGIDQSQGRYPDARTHYEAALVRWNRSLAKDATQYHLGAATHLNLGSLLADIGDTAGARAHYERARAIWIDSVGAEHPHIGDVELDLGVLEAQLGDHGKSRDHHARALAIYLAAYGENHERVATALSNLGDAIANTGDPAGAIAPLERALAIRRKLYGDDNLAVAASYCTIGIALVHAGQRPGDNLASCKKIREAHLPAGHGDIAQVISYIALGEQIAGDLDGALRDYEAASKIYAAAGLHQEHGEQETNLGIVWGTRGDRPRAIAHLTVADREWQAANQAHPNAIDTRFRLAQFLADAGDAARARALVTEARDQAKGDQRANLDTWLAEHAR